MTDSDKVDSLDQHTEALIHAVHKELIALRGNFGQLNRQKFSQYSVLHEVCGGYEDNDDYLIFRQEMDRIVSTSNRNEAAAALSIIAPADLLLDRLEYVVEHFEDDSGETRDQRTARRWSDRGMVKVATELVNQALVKSWLAREIMILGLAGDESGLVLNFGYYFAEYLESFPPMVAIWLAADNKYSEAFIEIEHDARDFKVFERRDEDHRLEQYRIPIQLPDALTDPEHIDSEIGIVISIDAVGAPMRAVTFKDETQLGDDLKIEFSVFREVALIEVRKNVFDRFSPFLALPPL